MVSRVMTPSCNPARAMTGLIVEHGSKPEENAIFWLTMVRMRPVDGSIASTEPFAWPRALTATWRITGSSYSALSSLVGSPYAEMPDFLWRVRVVEFAGAAATATAKVPARKRQSTGINCLKAGLGCMESYIGPRIAYCSLLNASVRKLYMRAQLLRRTAFLSGTAGRRDRCGAPQDDRAQGEAAGGRPRPVRNHSRAETTALQANGPSDPARKQWLRLLSAVAWLRLLRPTFALLQTACRCRPLERRDAGAGPTPYAGRARSCRGCQCFPSGKRGRYRGPGPSVRSCTKSRCRIFRAGHW